MATSQKEGKLVERTHVASMRKVLLALKLHLTVYAYTCATYPLPVILYPALLLDSGGDLKRIGLDLGNPFMHVLFLL